jgi:hypothetical protein
MSAPKRRVFTLILGLAVVLALLLPSLRPRPTPRYTVTDLGVLPRDARRESTITAILWVSVACITTRNARFC